MTEVMAQQVRQAHCKYRLILGLKPDLSVVKQKKVLAKIKELISGAGGKMGEVKSKGLTKLAYPIADFTEANFTNIFFTFERSEKGRSVSDATFERSEKASERSERSIPGRNIKLLQKELGLIKEVLRMMVIREEVKPKGS